MMGWFCDGGVSGSRHFCSIYALALTGGFCGQVGNCLPSFNDGLNLVSYAEFCGRSNEGTDFFFFSLSNTWQGRFLRLGQGR